MGVECLEFRRKPVQRAFTGRIARLISKSWKLMWLIPTWMVSSKATGYAITQKMPVAVASGTATKIILQLASWPSA